MIEYIAISVGAFVLGYVSGTDKEEIEEKHEHHHINTDEANFSGAKGGGANGSLNIEEVNQEGVITDYTSGATGGGADGIVNK